MMNVSESSARKLLKGLGYASADEWPSTKLAKRLGGFKDNPPASGELEDTDDKNLFDALMEAIENGEEIEVTEAAGNGSAKKGKVKAVAKGKASAKAKSEGKAKKEESDRPTILGYSPAQVARWLGKQNFTFEQAQAVLSHYRIDMKDSTLRTYLTDGKRDDEKYGKCIGPKPAERKELLAFKKS